MPADFIPSPGDIYVDDAVTTVDKAQVVQLFNDIRDLLLLDLVEVDDTESPTTGEPPEPVPLVLDPVADRAGGYDSTGTLTANLEISLEPTGQRYGRKVFFHRSGVDGAFSASVTGLRGDLQVTVPSGSTLAAMHDGSSWVSLGLIGAAGGGGGLSSFLTQVTDVTGDISLTAANAMYGVAGGAARHLTLRTKPATGSSAIVITLPDDAPIGKWYIIRGESHTGPLTVVNQSAAGSLNGVNGATLTVATKAGAAVLVEMEEQPGSAAVALVRGDTTEPETFPGLMTIGSVVIQPLTGFSGALTRTAHAGRVLLINGNTTINVEDGMTATIISTGSYTVNAGGTGVSLGEGDSISVVVIGTSVYRTPVVALELMPTS